MNDKKLTEEQIEKAAEAAYMRFREVRSYAVVNQSLTWHNMADREKNYWRDAVEAAAPHLQYAPTPAQVYGDAIEAMKVAYEDPHSALPPMAAAATVLLARVSLPIADDEWKEIGSTPAMWRGDLDRIIANRRNRILKPEPPSLEREIDTFFERACFDINPPTHKIELRRALMALISRHSEVQHGK